MGTYQKKVSLSVVDGNQENDKELGTLNIKRCEIMHSFRESNQERKKRRISTKGKQMNEKGRESTRGRTNI